MQQAPRHLNIAQLKIKFGEIIDRIISVDRLTKYNKELKYLIKVTMRKVKDAHKSLAEAAEELDVDLSKYKNLKHNYRMEFSDEEIEEMGITSLRSHIKNLIENIHDWSGINKHKENGKRNELK